MASWIIPCNPKYYDVFGAFRTLNTVDWRQTAISIEPGDIVYIYTGRPVQAITHKCIAVAVDIPFEDVNDSDVEFNIVTVDNPEPLKPHDRYMRLKLIREYDLHVLSYSKLVEKGLKGSIQGQRHTGDIIQSVIDSVI